MGLRLTFRRVAFTLAVHAHDRFPRLVPPLVVQWVEDGFYDAGLRVTLRRATSEYRAATADTIPAPSAGWSCLAGDLPDHDAGVIDDADMAKDLHDNEGWLSGGPQRKAWVAG